MPQTQENHTKPAMANQFLSVITGQSLGDITQDLCDFSLEEQNAAAEAQGIQPTASSEFAPVLGKTITYIVACVLFNENKEILMIQEAKPSCAGKWYLPAGRMEKGESICEAAVREVYEETGLNAEMTTLLVIEAAGGSWFRFVLTGCITGGSLKTLDQADNESLQAKWVSDVNELTLRANDILSLIDIGKAYENRQHSPQQQQQAQAQQQPQPQLIWHPEVLPTKYSHHKNYLRVFVVIRKRTSNSLVVLISEKNAYHFPTVEIHPQRSLHSTLRKFMIEMFGAEVPQHRPHGILSVEHCPSQTPHTTDGICLNMLVVFRPPVEEVTLISKCVWYPLTKPVEERVEQMFSNKYATIPLNVIR